MTTWKKFPLSEIASIGSGAGFPIADQGSEGEEFPFIKVSDMNLPSNERIIQTWNNSVSEVVRHKLRATAFRAGSVIFPKIGAAIATNKKRILTRPTCVDNNVMAVAANLGFGQRFGLDTKQVLGHFTVRQDLQCPNTIAPGFGQQVEGAVRVLAITPADTLPDNFTVGQQIIEIALYLVSEHRIARQHWQGE